jgi:hypothetical protein
MDVLLGLGVQGMAGASQDKQVPLSSPRPIWLLALNPILRLIWELPYVPADMGLRYQGHTPCLLSLLPSHFCLLYLYLQRNSVCARLS